MSSSKGENVKVAVRCRPPNRMEEEKNEAVVVSVNPSTGSVQVRKPESDEKKQFTFDCAFPPGKGNNNQQKDKSILVL